MTGRRVDDIEGGLIQRFGRTGVGVWSIKHVVTPLLLRAYRWTHGRILPRNTPVLLLTTIGRRSGKERTVPVYYLRDGERLVVCNVNPGFERPNPWTLNLRAKPIARVQLGADVDTYRAREADSEEVDRYWPALVSLWPAYASFYGRSYERSIFILEPEEPHARTTTPGAAAV